MGKGASKPKHMSDEEWEEYKRSAEYKEDVSGHDDSQYEPPED